MLLRLKSIIQDDNKKMSLEWTRETLAMANREIGKESVMRRITIDKKNPKGKIVQR